MLKLRAKIPKYPNSNPCIGKILTKEEKPKNESKEAKSPTPQLTQESPKIEIKIAKTPKKLFPGANFLVSLNKSMIKNINTETEKIKSNTNINILILVNSFTLNKERKERLNFSVKLNIEILNIFIICLIFLKNK